MSEHRGIIVGSNAKIEWLLPCFYLHLRLYSDLPITFFDFGMTSIGRTFAEKRGRVIDIETSLWSSDQLTNEHKIKSAWFQKPLACKQSPYEETLWLDLDCQIKGPIEPIFDLLTEDHWLAIRKEPKNPEKIIADKLLAYPDLDYYNSGVMAFKQNSPFIQAWIDLCPLWKDHVPGDQDVLSLLLKEHPDKVCLLERKFNHLLYIDALDDILSAHIVHFHSGFKNFLCDQYLKLEALSANPLTELSR